MNTLEKLKQNYELLMSRENQFLFFKDLAEYIDYVLKEPTFEKVFAQQMAERNTKNSEIRELKDSEQSLETWSSFEELLQFYKAYNFVKDGKDYPAILESGDDNKYGFDATDIANVSFMTDDLQTLRNDNYDARKDKISYLHKNKFKEAVKTAHSYLIQVAEEQKNNNQIEKNKNGQVEKIIVGSLVYDTDGGIYFKNKHIKMRSQIQDLCILFMKNHKNFVGYSTIKDELIDAKKRPITSFKTITKYVNELHKLLKNCFKKKVIFNQEKDAYIFDIEHKFKKLNKK